MAENWKEVCGISEKEIEILEAAADTEEEIINLDTLSDEVIRIMLKQLMKLDIKRHKEDYKKYHAELRAAAETGIIYDREIVALVLEIKKLKEKVESLYDKKDRLIEQIDYYQVENEELSKSLKD